MAENFINFEKIKKNGFNFNSAEIQADVTLRNLGEKLKEYNNGKLPTSNLEFLAAMVQNTTAKVSYLNDQKEKEKQAAIQAASAATDAKNRAEEEARLAREAAKKADVEKAEAAAKAEAEKAKVALEVEAEKAQAVKQAADEQLKALQDIANNLIYVETTPLIFSLAEAILEKKMAIAPKVEPNTVVVPSATGPTPELPQVSQFTLSDDLFGGSPINSESEIVINKSKQIQEGR